MGKALYRKYRSTKLADVVGQNHITDLLSRALKAGRVSHAYLFTGPRGVGKTSIARILAHEINELPYDETSRHLDIIEIDAASNNGVEDVRDLREKVRLAPVSAKRKVYIIDEVHMLSKPAFNALLKTLEEPPEHVVFILATTDVEKLPATIISRTQRYAFRAISSDDAIKHLRYIAEQEKITISDEALALIAERGDGSFRDSISLLDQLSSLTDDKSGITNELVETALGLAPKSVVSNIMTAVEKHDVAQLATILTDTENDGVSAAVIAEQLIRFIRNDIAAKPLRLHLLDGLLDVAKSSQPSIKLLSVLGNAALESKPKSAALAAPVLEVSATIEELSKQATQPVPAMPKAKKAVDAPKKAEAPVAPAASVLETAVEAASPDTPFTWEAFVEYTRQHHLALYSVLSKCSHELDGSNLTLYTLNAFYKKKLDDPKYHTHLYESLKATCGSQLTIHTIPTGAPMQSSQAAAIADIMGGGIEVSPETI